MWTDTKIRNDRSFSCQVVSHNYIIIPFYFRVFILCTIVISGNQLFHMNEFFWIFFIPSTLDLSLLNMHMKYDHGKYLEAQYLNTPLNKVPI